MVYRAAAFGPFTKTRTARCGSAQKTDWCVLSGGKFFRFTVSQQMPVDAINCILEDDAGCLWLSTLHGIFGSNARQFNAVADGKAATVQPFIVGTADGMKTAESNGETQPAGWKARDGRLWFPTGKGWL